MQLLMDNFTIVLSCHYTYFYCYIIHSYNVFIKLLLLQQNNYMKLQFENKLLSSENQKQTALIC